MLFFPACSRKRLLTVRSWQCCVYRCTSYEVDLPGLFVWCMCLCLCSRTESDARDSITSHNGYAVCGECPLICKRSTLSLGLCRIVSPKSCVSPKSMVCIYESLDVGCSLLVDQSREETLGLVDFSCPRRSVIPIHGYFDIVAIFLYRRKILDFLQAALICFTGCHSSIDGNCTAVGYGTAGR